MRISQFNKAKLMKVIAVISTVSIILAVIASIFNNLLIIKLIRYLDTAQKALPKIEKASQLYIENNTSQEQTEK